MRRAFFVLLLAGASTALAAVAQEAASYGTLVLQSPVQAVATINGEGTFLLVPGQDLRWNRIRPGSYRIGVSSGGQQWQREVQVQPGRTETLVAALSSAGSPLAVGAPPPPPVTAAVSAYIPPASVPPPPRTETLSTSPETVTQQRKEDREEQEAQRRREEDLLRQQREDRATEQREREAETRALREELRREREMQAEQGKSRKPKRPKVH